MAPVSIPAQKVNTYHGRLVPSGSTLSSAEDARAQQQKEAFWQAKKPGAKRRAKPIVTETPRRASLESCRILDNVMYRGLKVRIW